MKKELIFILSIALLTLSMGVNKLQESHLFVQFRIITLSEDSQAETIDHKMNNKSGIESSKTDYITSTYFCTLKPGTDYTEDDFVGWFSKMGYEISCFHKGVQGVDHVYSPHELKVCVDEE